MKNKDYLKRLCVFIFMLSGLLSAYIDNAQAQNINDAFVLVDVSGTMKHAPNDEAKLIIEEILDGKYNSSNWRSRNWETVIDRNEKSPLSSQRSIMKDGSYLCVMPFGNMNTMEGRKHKRISNGDWRDLYNGYFPNRFNDGYTYLELAKAYVGSVAYTSNVKYAYVFIYSDQMNDQIANNDYGNYQRIMDDLGTNNRNSYEKVSILRKSVFYNNKKINYSIDIWRFTSYETEIDNIEDPVDELPLPPVDVVKITSPRSNDIRKGDVFKLKWTGSSTADINIQFDKKNINRQDQKEYYNLQRKGNSADITFNKSGDYSIIVSKGRARDSITASVSSNPASIFFTLLIIILLVCGAVLLYRKLFNNDSPTPPYRRTDPWPTPDNNDNWE